MDRVNVTNNEANQRIDRFLRKYLKDISLSDIYKMLRKKTVKVNGGKVAQNYRLLEGDVIEIGIDREGGEAKAVLPAGKDFSIVYEDNNILIVNKPPELIVHPDINHKENTLTDQVIYYLYQKGEYDPEKEKTFRIAAANRLDLNTGGLVLFGKNYESLQNLSMMVRDRLLEKYYICIVKGIMKDSRDIKAYLTKDQEKNKVKITNESTADSKEIHTVIKPLKASEKYTLLEINLITGRSHQIRAQLASIGHPIIGDVKYGIREVNEYFKKTFKLSNQFLYAYKLSFDKAVNNLQYLEGKTYCSELPKTYKTIIEEFFQYNMEL